MARFQSPYRGFKVIMNPPVTREVNGRLYTEPGRTLKFVDGVYQTSKEDEIEFLRQLGNKSRDIFEIDEVKLAKARMAAKKINEIKQDLDLSPEEEKLMQDKEPAAVRGTVNSDKGDSKAQSIKKSQKEKKKDEREPLEIQDDKEKEEPKTLPKEPKKQSDNAPKQEEEKNKLDEGA